jgi:hypothetical protein
MNSSKQWKGLRPILSTHVVPRLRRYKHGAPVQTAGSQEHPKRSLGEFALPELGGADRDRTGDPLLAKQVLSQLSYSPLTVVVGLGRFELPTSPLSGVRSNQLSYRPAGCARVS